MPRDVTEHFSVEEFACHSGEPYPSEWIDERLEPLCLTLEVIRSAAGDRPITVDSGYRTLAYDERLYEASAKDGSVAPASRSQHPQGRAGDIVHALLSPLALHELILRLQQSGELPQLGGLGLYPRFVHVDVRPWEGHLAQWTGGRLSNVA